MCSATSACLSYNVWVAEDFKPGDGGVLPGLVSDTGVEAFAVEQDTSNQPPPDQQASPPDGETPPPPKLNPFSLRPQWRSDGSLILWQIVNQGHRGPVGLDPQKAALKPGRWTRIEQEFVLNTPGQPDGTMRAYVDGKLVHEAYGVGFRMDEVQSFQAIVGDIHNLRNGVWSGAPAETRMKLSPLELRMR